MRMRRRIRNTQAERRMKRAEMSKRLFFHINTVGRDPQKKAEMIG